MTRMKKDESGFEEMWRRQEIRNQVLSEEGSSQKRHPKSSAMRVLSKQQRASRIC